MQKGFEFKTELAEICSSILLDFRNGSLLLRCVAKYLPFLDTYLHHQYVDSSICGTSSYILSVSRSCQSCVRCFFFTICLDATLFYSKCNINMLYRFHNHFGFQQNIQTIKFLINFQRVFLVFALLFQATLDANWLMKINFARTMPHLRWIHTARNLL